MPKTIEVTAKKNVDGEDRVATISIEVGETAAESIEMFGDEVVNSNFIGSAKITAQAGMRRKLEANKSQDEIAADFAAWKPGVALARETDPLAAALARFGKLDPEAQKEFMANLKKKVGGK